MSDHKKVDEHTGTETTNHEWDEIQELDTPMPRWWINIMYITIVWAIGYMIVMPAIPLINGYTKGIIGFSDRTRVAVAVEKMHEDRSVNSEKLVGASIASIQNDPDLLRFATQQGRTLFGDNCETCHGRRGQGVPGYPNLNDDIWIWGGSFADIKQTINYGIRAEHDDTRFGSMAAYGRDELLEPAQIDDLVQHVLGISGQRSDTVAAARGAGLFAENCASCHGDAGKGMRENGAPDLTDTDWLYGGTAALLRETIFNGREGLMPNWDTRLSEAQITALSVYVHSDLGGGE
ncbi:MAG: cytochrome-c oxidase, cbb3-type subunit III [Robiginitomaculum sp.]|nr:MAG: cytochrome-c oxidase, cbb3-type subunit III [Robiginitomaculum sp.]